VVSLLGVAATQTSNQRNFRPELNATDGCSNRDYLQLNLQSSAVNRHYLQLKYVSGHRRRPVRRAVRAATSGTKFTRPSKNPPIWVACGQTFPILIMLDFADIPCVLGNLVY
jgi:hypothetical protein